MERGESLPDWSKRAKPDVFQSVAVLAHVATRLRDMHDAGYVHRDIKPENMMFLQRENRWTVIDFGCAARAGEVAPLAYTLVYAPPEVAEALDTGTRTIQVTPAMDAWALGVVAFELLTGQSAFKLVIEGRDSVRYQHPTLPRQGQLRMRTGGTDCHAGCNRLEGVRHRLQVCRCISSKVDVGRQTVAIACMIVRRAPPGAHACAATAVARPVRRPTVASAPPLCHCLVSSRTLFTHGLTQSGAGD